MKRGIFSRKEKQDRYCGKTREEVKEILSILCAMQDDIAMTEEEDEAMEIAIQAVADVRNRMKR